MGSMNILRRLQWCRRLLVPAAVASGCGGTANVIEITVVDGGGTSPAPAPPAPSSADDGGVAPWSVEGRLTPNEAQPGDHLGEAVAATATRAYASSQARSASGDAIGAIYSFVREGARLHRDARIDLAKGERAASLAAAGDSLLAVIEGPRSGGTRTTARLVEYVAHGSSFTAKVVGEIARPRSVAFDGQRAAVLAGEAGEHTVLFVLARRSDGFVVEHKVDLLTAIERPEKPSMVGDLVVASAMSRVVVAQRRPEGTWTSQPIVVTPARPDCLQAVVAGGDIAVSVTPSGAEQQLRRFQPDGAGGWTASALSLPGEKGLYSTCAIAGTSSGFVVQRTDKSLHAYENGVGWRSDFPSGAPYASWGGESLAVAGDLTVLGDAASNVAGDQAGALHAFLRVAAEPTRRALGPLSAADARYFGLDLATDGETLVAATTDVVRFYRTDGAARWRETSSFALDWRSTRVVGDAVAHGEAPQFTRLGGGAALVVSSAPVTYPAQLGADRFRSLGSVVALAKGATGAWSPRARLGDVWDVRDAAVHGATVALRTHDDQAGTGAVTLYEVSGDALVPSLRIPYGAEPACSAAGAWCHARAMALSAARLVTTDGVKATAWERGPAGFVEAGVVPSSLAYVDAVALSGDRLALLGRDGAGQRHVELFPQGTRSAPIRFAVPDLSPMIDPGYVTRMGRMRETYAFVEQVGLTSDSVVVFDGRQASFYAIAAGGVRLTRQVALTDAEAGPTPAVDYAAAGTRMAAGGDLVAIGLPNAPFAHLAKAGAVKILAR